MNKVANIEGKGRDDLTLQILLCAENKIRTVSVNCSKSVRNIADGVKNSFTKFRKMLEDYSENIESVDPQLKNNQVLVDNLYQLEVAWEKGKEFLLDNNNYSRLIFFSQLIEILCEKYKELIELIEFRDPSIFVSVPGLLILKCLENEDIGICKEYNPNMFDQNKDCYKLYIELSDEYNKLKLKLNTLNNELNDIFFLYNFLEQCILFEENLDSVLKNNIGFEDFYDKEIMIKFLGKIKTLSMNLQREKPTEWNAFFDMAMNTISS